MMLLLCIVHHLIYIVKYKPEQTQNLTLFTQPFLLRIYELNNDGFSLSLYAAIEHYTGYMTIATFWSFIYFLMRIVESEIVISKNPLRIF